MELRPLLPRHHEVTVKGLIRDAFSGFPWYETLDDVELERRWRSYVSRPGFTGLLACEEGHSAVGACWWDETSADSIRLERGDELADFAIGRLPDKGRHIIWERDILVRVSDQRKGYGRQLRTGFLDRITTDGAMAVLTRMRDDNLPTLKLAESLGFEPTGISEPCPVKPGARHQFWYWTP